VPADDYSNIRDGWKSYYWTPMQVMLRNKYARTNSSEKYTDS
jgi:hypothetical protein